MSYIFVQLGDLQENNNAQFNATNDFDEDVDPQCNLLWSNQAIKCLLDIYPTFKVKLDNRRFVSKKIMCTHMKKEMSKFGHNFTPAQIENKLKGLQKSYKDRVDNKGPKKTGRGRKSIEYEKYSTHIISLSV